MESAKRWHDELKRYRDVFEEKFETSGRKVIDIYKGEGSKAEMGSQFNILYSNVSTLKPATYSRPPKPEVSRRFKDKSPAARVASTIIERCLSYEITQFTDYDSGLDNAVLDRLLPGRGVCWIRYEPETEQVEESITEDVEPLEQITSEHTPVDYVYWLDFAHQPARTWEEVDWVARKVYMSREAGINRFGDVFNDVPLTHEPYKNGDERNKLVHEELKKAEIWEIWDKSTSKVCWICEHYENELDKKDDPLGLDCFFPCPKPLYATLTTDSLIPRSDYSRYQDQAEELNVITARLSHLRKMLKIRGAYAGEESDIIKSILTSDDGMMTPIPNAMTWADKGGLRGMLEIVSIAEIPPAIQVLEQARESLIQQVYEISGISDILRGASNANETLGAQQIKSNFASIRLGDIKNDVARFAKDILQMKADIICSKYQPKTIVDMSGALYLPEIIENSALLDEAIALLKDERLRNFAIEIENDSLVELDENKEQQNRTQFLEASATFLEKSMKIAQVAPDMTALLGEMLLFGIRGFKVGNTIEGAFESTFDSLNEKAKSGQPSAEEVQMQAQQQIEQIQMESQDALEGQYQQFEQEKEQINQQNAMQTQQSELKRQQDAMTAKQAIADERMHNMQEMQRLKMDIEMLKMQLKEKKMTERLSKFETKDAATTIDEEGNEVESPIMLAMMQQNTQNTQMLAETMIQAMQMLTETMSREMGKPRMLSRDLNGNKIAIPVNDTMQ